MLAVEVYRYEELSEKAAERAQREYVDMLCADTWWYQSVYDTIRELGAEQGLEVDHIYFDLDDRMVTMDASYVPEGEAWRGSVESWRDGMRLELEDVAWEEYDSTYARFKDMVEDFCRQGMTMLRQEWEYLTGDEAMREFFQANEWFFLGDGTVVTGNVKEVAA